MVHVIAVDGPSGAGKGTICRKLARKLGFHYLDSGALYRLLGMVALRHRVSTSDNESLVQLAGNMDIQFKSSTGDEVKVLLEGEDVSIELRTEQTATLASQVAAHPEVREALLERQRLFARSPGLVADGRDMGTVVFPDANLKLYLTASIEERARRRYKELLEKGESVSLRALEMQVRARDERDINREASPLVAATDAIEIDTSELSIDEVLDAVLNIALLKGLMKVSQ